MQVDMPDTYAIDLSAQQRHQWENLLGVQPQRVLENVHERLFRQVMDGTREGGIPTVSTAFKAKVFSILSNELNARRMLTRMADCSE